MKKYLKNEEGITLVELLASLTILSVVIILIGSVHIFGQRQFTSQTEANSQANDLRYSLSVLSRDLRSTPYENVEQEDSVITLEDSLSYTYDQGSTSLYRNSEVLSRRIQHFNVDLNEDSRSAEITIRSTPNDLNQSEEYQTTIYFRR